MSKPTFDLNTLSTALRDYLKRGVTDRTERTLLNHFKEFMQKNYSGIKVNDVRHSHFESFLKSQSVSRKSLGTYRSRVNRFKSYIGLSKMKTTRKRKSKREKILERKIRRKYERKLAEKDDILCGYHETIDKKDAEIKEKDKQLEMIKSQGIELKYLQHLETKKAELEKKIAENEDIIAQQGVVKLICPKNGLVVSFGNDCQHCLDYVDCSACGKLLYPEQE